MNHRGRNARKGVQGFQHTPPPPAPPTAPPATTPTGAAPLSGLHLPTVDEPLSIPPCTSGTASWRPDPGRFSRREMRAQTGTYSFAIPPKIATWSERLPSDLAADVTDAEQALIRFDGYTTMTLGSQNTAIGPMSAILLRTESASSSQIENLTASAKQIALAELDQSHSPNAMTVLGNVRSMEAALRMSEHLHDDSILAMHRELLTRQPGYEHHAGRYRQEVVWIGPGQAGPRRADFVAPLPDLVAPAMSDLIHFMGRDDLPVLVQVAVAHAQFETIHPFVDGNGRTGRALAHALLRSKGVVTRTTVPVSAALLANTGAYFQALNDYRSGNARPLIETFAQAAREAAYHGQRLVDDLAAETEWATQQLRDVRADSSVWKVVPHLIEQPILNAKYLKERFGMTDAVANRTLSTLVSHGILTETTGQRRNRVWQQGNILTILDGYAEGFRRAR